MQKRFVCLAKSIRNGALCVAGKEYSNGTVGTWFRPVGREQDAIRDTSCSFNVGDIVTCRVDSRVPALPQSENYRLSLTPSWTTVGEFSPQNLKTLLDFPKTLWQNGANCSSKLGINDRVPESIACELQNSLYFIYITNASIQKEDISYETQRNRLRLSFQYNESNYSLPVTDPSLSKKYWKKVQVGESETIQKCYITVSLARPYFGYCYKLVAGYVPA